MMRNTMIKTHGWQVNENTYSEFQASVDGFGGTTDGRLYWYERNDVDLAGIQIKDQVLKPRSMIVQEAYAPRIMGTRYYDNVALNNQPLNVEIHDIFSTVRLSDNTIDLMVGSMSNAQTDTNNYFGLPVSFEPTEGIGATDQTNLGGGLLDTDFRDTEQIVACTSRKWAADFGGLVERDFAIGDLTGQMAEAVAQVPMRLTFRNDWGSGDAIASDRLHHVRIMIGVIDRANKFNELPPAFVGGAGCFIAIPPSIQYLTADVVEPSFLEQMTMIRRSRAI